MLCRDLATMSQEFGSIVRWGVGEVTVVPRPKGITPLGPSICPHEVCRFCNEYPENKCPWHTRRVFEKGETLESEVEVGGHSRLLRRESTVESTAETTLESESEVEAAAAEGVSSESSEKRGPGPEPSSAFAKRIRRGEI